MESSKAQNIKGSIWKIKGWANCYLIKGDKNILIDCGSQYDSTLVKKEVEIIVGLNNVHEIIFTHLHYDHIFNFKLFKNAEFYASAEEIEDLRKDPYGTILMQSITEEFSKLAINTFKDTDRLLMINTPGHTRGSVCFISNEDKVVFTGDTYFGENVFGRTDLPTSVPEKMERSLKKLEDYKGFLMLSGHDYT